MTSKNNNKDNIEGKEKLLKRTLPGRLAAKKMGKLGGRPKKLNAEKKALVQKLYDNPKNTIEDICKILGISKPSFYAYLYGCYPRLTLNPPLIGIETLLSGFF